MERFTSPEGIKKSYEGSKESIERPMGSSMEKVREQAHQGDFGEKFALNQKPKEKVEQELEGTTEHLKQEEARIHKVGNQFEEKVKGARFITNNPS